MWRPRARREVLHPERDADPAQRRPVLRVEPVEDDVPDRTQVGRCSGVHDVEPGVGEGGEGVAAVVGIGERCIQPRPSNRFTTLDSRDSEPFVRKASSLIRSLRPGASDRWLSVRYSNSVMPCACCSGASSRPGSSMISEITLVHAAFSSPSSHVGSSPPTSGVARSVVTRRPRPWFRARTLQVKP